MSNQARNVSKFRIVGTKEFFSGRTVKTNCGLLFPFLYPRMDFTECITPPLISISVPEIETGSSVRVLKINRDTDAMMEAPLHEIQGSIELKSSALRSLLWRDVQMQQGIILAHSLAIVSN